MATYTIQQPDGSIYQITTPDTDPPVGSPTPTTPTPGGPEPAAPQLGFLQQAGQALRDVVFPVPGEERQAAILTSGALGAPADILNAPGVISGALGGPRYHIPLGSSDIATQLGVDPASMSGLERIAQTIAGAASPGVFLKAASGLGILPGVANKLYPFLSAGPRGDLAMGAASAAGSELGRQITPGSVVGPLVGSIAGPGIVSALHTAIGAGVKALGAPTVARQDLRTAEQALKETISPAQQALEATVLRPRPGTSMLPGARQAGGAALADVAAQAQAVPAKSAQEGIDLIESIAPNLDRMATLGKAKQFFQQEFFEKGRKNLGTLFDATEKVTGDAPVVNVTKFRERAAQTLAETQALGQPVPAGARAAAGLGLGKTDLLELLESGGTTPLNKAQRAVAEQIATAGDEVTIPFWMARRLESSLSQAAYRHGTPIGTMTQGKARRLLTDLQDDLHTFYTGPEATAVNPDIEQALQGVGATGGATVAEALPLAKQKYREFIETTNRTVISKLLDDNPVAQERFLKAFTTGTDHAQLLAVKRTASPEVWDTLGSFVLADLHKKASSSGQFDMGSMAKELQRLRKSGRMDVLYTPEQVANIERYAASLTSQDTTFATTFRQALQKKTPEQVVDFVTSPGDYSRTQQFRSIAQPETYDAVVKAWAVKFGEDAQTLTPAQMRSKYGSMTQRETLSGGGVAPSQLDILLTEYPGVADEITMALAHIRPRQHAVEAAKAQVETRAEGGAGVAGFVRTAGLATLAHGIYTGQPITLAGGSILLGAPYAARRLANTDTGRRVIREGLAGRYAPSNVRWALEALGNTAPENQ